MVHEALPDELKCVATCINVKDTMVVSAYAKRMDYADTQDYNMDMVPYGIVYSKSYAIGGTGYTAGGEPILFRLGLRHDLIVSGHVVYRTVPYQVRRFRFGIRHAGLAHYGRRTYTPLDGGIGGVACGGDAQRQLRLPQYRKLIGA